jgi:hypothetical protein
MIMKKIFLTGWICLIALIIQLSGCDETKEYAYDRYIYMDAGALELYYGDEEQVTASPVSERNAIQWSSEDPAVATVSSTGLVKATGVGSTNIVASLGNDRTLLPVTVTIPTVDKVVVAGENGRFQIAVQTLSERVATVRIIWNNNRDSTDIAVNNRIGIFTQIVDYSGENGYIFHVVGFDKFGNRSVSSETTATLLRNRDISARAMDDGALTVQWGSNIQYVDHCSLSYVNQSGQTVSQKAFPSEATTVINDYSAGLSYTTLFTLIPATTDTFRVETLAPAVVESTPFNGPHILSASAPCEIQARDFDCGGEGLAFHDTGTGTTTSYRADAGDYGSSAVRIESAGNIGSVVVGEWLVYTIEVRDAGVYAVDVRLSVNNTAGGSFNFSIDGNRSPTTVTPNQRSFNSWIYVFDTHPEFTQPTYRLSAGKHKFRFTVEPEAFNYIGFKFTYVGE